MQFLTTKQISGEIERIIRDADNFLILISPYVKISQMYLDRLVEAEKRNVKIFFVFGKEQLAEIEEEKFTLFNKMKMLYLENLHAKSYMNESSAIITSMNLYEFSELNNREMGLTVEKIENEKLYNDITKEANSIIQNSEPYFIKKNRNKVFRSYESSRTPKAHCIRCGDDIDLNPEKPMCYNCYSVWAEYFNYDYTERYCHICGNENDTSMAKPLCYSCYKAQASQL